MRNRSVSIDLCGTFTSWTFNATSGYFFATGFDTINPLLLARLGIAPGMPFEFVAQKA